MKEEIIYQSKKSLIVIYRNYINDDDANIILRRLDRLPFPEKRPKFMQYDIPRDELAMANDDVIKSGGYKYGIRKVPTLAWDGFTDEKGNQVGLTLKKIMENITDEFGIEYNSVLINRYKTLEDSINPHSDKEALGEDNSVAAISFGHPRDFKFNGKKGKGKEGEGKRFNLIFGNGDLMIMKGDVQKAFVHSIPKGASKELKKDMDAKNYKSELRISITYRYHAN